MNDVTNPYAPVVDTNAEVEVADVPWLEPPQSVRYRYTRELMQEFWVHRSLHHAGDRLARRKTAQLVAILGLVVGVCTGIVAWLDTPEHALSWTCIIVLLILSVLLLWAAVATLRTSSIEHAFAQMANRYLDDASNRHFFRQRTLTLEADGVRDVQPGGQSFTQWDALERIDYNDKVLLLYDSALSAFIVPRTAFATRGQFLGFVALAERLWREHQAPGGDRVPKHDPHQPQPPGAT